MSGTAAGIAAAVFGAAATVFGIVMPAVIFLPGILSSGSAFALDPTSDAGDDSAKVEVRIKVDDSVAIAVERASHKITMTPNSFFATDGTSDTITGSTNALNGFRITVRDSDGDTGLKQSGGETIPARGGALRAGAASGWNLSVGLLDHAAVTTSDQTAAKTGEPGEENFEAVYTFATSPMQREGAYSGKIVYTIAVNDPAADPDDPDGTPETKDPTFFTISSMQEMTPAIC